jgi:hypothetical protein
LSPAPYKGANGTPEAQKRSEYSCGADQSPQRNAILGLSGGFGWRSLATSDCALPARSGAVDSRRSGACASGPKLTAHAHCFSRTPTPPPEIHHDRQPQKRQPDPQHFTLQEGANRGSFQPYSAPGARFRVKWDSTGCIEIYDYPVASWATVLPTQNNIYSADGYSNDKKAAKYQIESPQLRYVCWTYQGDGKSSNPRHHYK